MSDVDRLIGSPAMEEVRAHVRACIQRDVPDGEEVVDYVSDAQILATLDEQYPGGAEACVSDLGLTIP